MIPRRSFSAVAWRYGVAPSLLFRWEAKPLMLSPRRRCRRSLRLFRFALPGPVSKESCERPQAGTIEIELATGHRMCADASVDIGVLRTLIEVLFDR
jgi:transposase